MYYVAYYPDGTDVDCHMPPDLDLEKVISLAWDDNEDGFEKIGPDPIKVEVYDDEHNLLAQEPSLS